MSTESTTTCRLSHNEVSTFDDRLGELLRKYKGFANPTAIFTVGAPGSGKSTFIDDVLGVHIDLHVFLRINIDDWVMKLKDFYKRGDCHKTTWPFINRLLNYAISERLCFIYDSTGSDVNFFTTLFGWLKHNGFTIKVFAIEVSDVETLLGRVETRRRTTGRGVPRDVVVQKHRDVLNSITAFKHIQALDKYHIYITTTQPCRCARSGSRVYRSQRFHYRQRV
jgi:predicted ABC-type ATPase